MESVREISELPQNIRLAGYLRRQAELDEVFARLRLNGREDETWTEEEWSEWAKYADNLDNWWYALSKEEKDFVRPIIERTAIIARGENINAALEGTC